MSLVGFSSKNHPQQVQVKGADDFTDDRRTRPEIFDPLHAVHGFTLDVAAASSNHKCEKFFDRKQNGLLQSWAHEVVWCNPPYSNLGDWLQKANQEVQYGDCPKVVLLLPANRCEQKWWQLWVEPYRDQPAQNGFQVTTRFLPGRPRFNYPPGRKVPVKGDRPPFGLVVVVMEKT